MKFLGIFFCSIGAIKLTIALVMRHKEKKGGA